MTSNPQCFNSIYLWIFLPIAGLIPTGYIMKFTDIPGQGIDQLIASSVDECASRCWNNQDCCVFEYSQAERQCQLHGNCTASDYDPKAYRDYVMFQKSKHISELSFTSEKSSEKVVTSLVFNSSRCHFIFPKVFVICHYLTISGCTLNKRFQRNTSEFAILLE